MTEWLYGRQAVREMLRAKRRRVHRVVVAQGNQRTDIVEEIHALALAARCPVEMLDRNALDRFVAGANHQGIAALVADYPYIELNALLKPQREEPPFLLCLDHVQDPQNLGTLLRTADAVGVHGVILPERRAAGITPSVSNASAGAVEHLQVAQVVNLTRALEELKKHDIWIAGLEHATNAIPYNRADFRGALALVVGSEGEGLSRLVRETCDWLVSLPMRGQIESLNAAVAGSIILYATWQARQFSAARAT